MKKGILSILLTLVLMVGLLPVKAEAVSEDKQEEIHKIVSVMISDYAKKMVRADCATEAFIDFANHGLFGGGADMTVKEGDAVLSTILNSETGQAALIEGITGGILLSHQLHTTEIHMSGSTNWSSYGHYFGFFAFEGAEPINSQYLGTNSNCTHLYGTELYPHGSNDYDDMMALIGGTVRFDFTITPTQVQRDSVMYTIGISINDRFDFQGNEFETMKDKGYDTSADQRLNQLGYLMTFMGLDEFDWKFEKSFTVEVPNTCDHASDASYLWHVNQGDVPPTTKTEDGYTANRLFPKYRIAESKQQIGTYELEKNIVLRHDAPWVLEYDSVGMQSIHLTPVYSPNAKLPYMIHSGTDRIMFSKYHYKDDGAVEEANMVYTRAFTGVILTEKTYYKSHSYTVRWENDPQSGSILVSIYDHTAGETVMEPTAMDMYWETSSEAKGQTKPIQKDFVIEDDFIINYIGSQYIPLSDQITEIRIYENGTMPNEYRAPTCTEGGGIVHTCRDCGYSYMTDTVPATGHSFGEYVYDNNSSCTEDGTQTRKCTVCGVKETVHAPDTALGHDYKSVVTAPTLTAEGYTTYTCTRCGDSYKDDFVAKKEHTYVPVVTEPTCTEQGFTTYTCSECGDSYVDDYTDMIEHTPVIDPAVEPTCVEKGKTEGSHCGVCGFVIKKQANISTVNRHDYEEEITKIPTYDEDGEVTYTCKDCGKTEIKVIPAFEKPTPTNPFADVSESDWFYTPVMWAVEADVTGGTSKNTFSPDRSCTRGQVVTFLWAANGKPEPKMSACPFTDVSPSDWYYKPVLWAVENGITTGISETAFGPELDCTRAQIVTFLYAAAGKPQISGSSTFRDVADSDWFAKPVIWAAENHVTGGIGGGNFGPNNVCTRGQIVTFLYKVYGSAEELPEKPQEPETPEQPAEPLSWNGFAIPTEGEIDAYNSSSPAYRSPYIAGWLQIGKTVKFKEYSIDFKADHVPEGTYCSLANWYMDLSELEKTHTNVHTNSGSIQAYAGLQNTNTDKGTAAIMSFWDVFATDANGEEIVIRAERVYPDGDNSFDNEGTGVNCIQHFDWEPDHWYRMLLQCSTSPETGNTQVEQWVCDLETGKWTKLCVFDTGLKNSCFVGNVAFFLENYLKSTAGDVRSMEVRNPRIRKVGNTEWTNLTQAYITSQGGVPNYNGSYAFGAADDRFWMITSGVGGDWYTDGTGQKAQTYTVRNDATGSPY